ncbi:MAG: AbrB/MazE/SpoVT family DNA-binding domain-containing protein [Candidatus Tectomicrobia bacterium]|uniref:AbrB/MazE/SpoVT family DNA-binding domain-containing protein n=1 Tax=Tectimicrobiota bacterium TaxID=2528274 RepID=A0A932ZUP9_UNCTE|nr:AbrB/MazE/SpoVT family DNA-binding domain-containing protein [Candidatus Tectomicrobia bacterium]MBI2176994.1 AbrB/MazE/SpoVT family DNA-binding domain-containing protein [Candidatus Tectomicrobia bacterium]MBI3026253.1 AbrB/MazE/SpoVT family DNA-binding domain-containing protein [Candidatus Tectomicrobia bacterium]MBI4251988.1 AbrB/MazE/SpoVT family DNA-binding domain-containing protein [Candidatus Tectomicrobia bacterium]
MKATVAKWGNSLALRIPSPLAEECQLKEGTRVEIVRNGKGLLIRKPRFVLADLLAAITPGNIHSEMGTGEAAGREEW